MRKLVLPVGAKPTAPLKSSKKAKPKTKTKTKTKKRGSK
jgi:hypothetical protein